MCVCICVIKSVGVSERVCCVRECECASVYVRVSVSD